MSAASISATATPRRGCSTAKPSATKASTASRTGLRDTFNCRNSSGTDRDCPGTKDPSRIAARSVA